MKYFMFEIRSGKRAFNWYSQGEDEPDARLNLWSKMSGISLEIDDVKLIKVYDELPSHVQI